MNSASVTIAKPQSIDWTVPLWLARAFALDVRGLAIMRIGMATLLLWDLAFRACDLTAHYTDAGVLPRAARIAMTWEYCESWWMSLHMLSGSWLWQAVLFGVAGIAAALVLVGYKTKPALLISCVLLLSLHGRFPLLTQGGDMLLRCMLFWSLFVPLDARWSVTSWQGARSDRSMKSDASPSQGYVVSMGTAAIVCQLGMMYLFTAMLKTSPSWRSEFSAAYYALAIDHFTTSWGYVALRYPVLLQLLTAGSLLLEWLGPLLLLAPMGHRSIRIAVPLAFIGFHLGLVATMHLGTFPWICMLFWVALFPPNVWEALDRLLVRCKSWWGRGGSSQRDHTQCNVRPLVFVGSPASNAIAAFLLGYVLLLNINRLHNPFASVGQAPLSLLGKVTGLQQYWNMFSPGPYRFGSWLRLEGVTADGRLVNLYQPDAPLDDVKPTSVSGSYPTQYWRRCLVTLYEFEESSHQEGVLRYFAGNWNAGHDASEAVVAARLVHMVEPVDVRSTSEIVRQPLERRVLREITLDQ